MCSIWMKVSNGWAYWDTTLPCKEVSSRGIGGEERFKWGLSGVVGALGGRWGACLQRPYIVETMHSYTLPM